MSTDNLETGYTKREFLKLLGITGFAGAAAIKCTINAATKDFVISAGTDVSDVDLPNKKTQYPPNKPNYIYVNNGWYWGGWQTDGRWQYYRLNHLPGPCIFHDVPLMNGPTGSYRLGPWKP